MNTRSDRVQRTLALTAGLLASLPSCAWELAGSHTVRLHPRAGEAQVIGTLRVEPEGEEFRFDLKLDTAKFQDFFLSMREFKCLQAEQEVHCHVPYPYHQPATLTAGDLSWLEHALLFFYKTPRDFGARLWNGIYYRLEITDDGLVGTPEAVDLEQISAPPDDATVPPFDPAQRSRIDPASRAFVRLSID